MIRTESWFRRAAGKGAMPTIRHQAVVRAARPRRVYYGPQGSADREALATEEGVTSKHPSGDQVTRIGCVGKGTLLLCVTRCYGPSLEVGTS